MTRILLIDDDEMFREMLKLTLTKAGFELVDLEDGRKAIETFKENPFDIVITDILMPKMDGIEIINAFKDNYPDVKIIAISGGGRIDASDYLEIAGGLGADFTISKPFKKEELLTTIKLCLTN